MSTIKISMCGEDSETSLARICAGLSFAGVVFDVVEDGCYWVIKFR